MTTRFVRVSELITPRWLRAGTARAIVFAVAVQLDLLADTAAAAVRRRFPVDGDSVDALPLLERERLIRRGPFETDAQFAPRLAAWYDSRRRIGNPYALLEQLRGYFANFTISAELIYRNGTRIRLSELGAISRDAILWNAPAGGAPGQGNPGDNWARFVLIFNRSPVFFSPEWLLVPTVWGTRGARHTQGTVVILDPAGTARLWGYPTPLPTWGALNTAGITWASLSNSSQILEFTI